MNDSLSARVLNAMLYDVLQAAIMLLFLLSSAATNRRKHFVDPGVAHPIPLPGLSLRRVPAIVQVAVLSWGQKGVADDVSQRVVSFQLAGKMASDPPSGAG